MLKSTVPTWAKLAVWDGVPALALMAKTSRSGREKRTALFQLRPSSSCHWLTVLLNLTIRPTSGWAVPWKLMLGAGRPPGITEPLTLQVPAAAPPLQTSPSESVVVWLPDWKTAA